MELPPAKRIKLNPVGEDAYLLPDGTVVLDEYKIVKVQRMWLHKAYSPPSGVMYVKLVSSQVGVRVKPSDVPGFGCLFLGDQDVLVDPGDGPLGRSSARAGPTGLPGLEAPVVDCI